MPPKFKRHLNDDDVTGSVKSERRNLLEDDSDEEEDFFLRGPSGPRFGPRNDKIKHVQNQVDEVIDVMQENITKVIERGERLDELQDKSESLSDNATAFSNRSKQLRRQMWWRGCKIKAIMALVAVILLLVIIIHGKKKYSVTETHAQCTTYWWNRGGISQCKITESQLWKKQWWKTRALPRSCLLERVEEGHIVLDLDIPVRKSDVALGCLALLLDNQSGGPCLRPPSTYVHTKCNRSNTPKRCGRGDDVRGRLCPEMRRLRRLLQNEDMRTENAQERTGL
ncbi:hypothetical protein PANDA_018454 [Ailuropoda melanoleuca]|uniref:Vesicle-associated membrane protein 4 n=3 Tax=Laurasiatheria TaxID=314145 RepID=D2I017_AILME|nr:hypothetical protein PANDA_018454 [Ailuropoda melanoleuca]